MLGLGGLSSLVLGDFLGGWELSPSYTPGAPDVHWWVCHASVLVGCLLCAYVEFKHTQKSIILLDIIHNFYYIQ